MGYTQALHLPPCSCNLSSARHARWGLRNSQGSGHLSRFGLDAELVMRSFPNPARWPVHWLDAYWIGMYISGFVISKAAFCGRLVLLRSQRSSSLPARVDIWVDMSLGVVDCFPLLISHPFEANS